MMGSQKVMGPQPLPLALFLPVQEGINFILLHIQLQHTILIRA